MADSKLKYTLAFSLLQKLCRDEKNNFVISPLSLSVSFAMLTAGLRGETKGELLKLFGTSDESELHSMFCDLLSRKDLPLKTANKYLVAEELTIHQRFESLIKEKYESEIECVDFVHDSKEIEAQVNAWVAKKTNSMIPELLPKDTLDKDNIFVLLNAVYFKGSWFEEFKPIGELLDFKLRSGEKVQRSFIAKKSRNFRYATTDRLHLVGIPYQEAGFYMLLAMPRNENDHIDEVIAGMQPSELISAIKSPVSRGKEMLLSLPKFKIEYSFQSVQNHLKELGVEKIFVPNSGDFGDLFVERGKGPFVDSIIHKAVIEVDEKGTTAAAATKIGFRLCCMPLCVEFNRPFCFFVMSANDLVCFNGICAQP